LVDGEQRFPLFMSRGPTVRRHCGAVPGMTELGTNLEHVAIYQTYCYRQGDKFAE